MTRTDPTYRLPLILVAIFVTIGIGLGAPIDFVTSGFTQTEQEQDPAAKSDSPTADSTLPAPLPSELRTPLNDPYAINKKPKAAEGIGVDPMIGEMLVMDIPFNDEQNRSVMIGDYFDGKRPVMLSFNYSNCPKLCSVQLENMTLTLSEVAKRFKVNDDFQVVSISIDPNEQASRARKTKAIYTEIYHVPETDDGWHFLTGKQQDIELMADLCGFRYKYIREQKLYSHPPVFILISPKGKIVRYIHGLSYDSKTIEQALIESAQGKIGSPINILSYGLGCFLYDESTGKYTFQAIAAMRIGGFLTVFLLLITLIPYWFFRRGQTMAEIEPKKTGLPQPHPTGTSG